MLPYFEDAISCQVIAGVAAYHMPADVFLERLLDLAHRDIHMHGFRFPTSAKGPGRTR